MLNYNLIFNFPKFFSILFLILKKLVFILSSRSPYPFRPYNNTKISYHYALNVRNHLPSKKIFKRNARGENTAFLKSVVIRLRINAEYRIFALSSLVVDDCTPMQCLLDCLLTCLAALHPFHRKKQSGCEGKPQKIFSPSKSAHIPCWVFSRRESQQGVCCCRNQITRKAQAANWVTIPINKPV